MITAACLQTDVFTNLEQPDLDHSICGHSVYEDVNYILWLSLGCIGERSVLTNELAGDTTYKHCILNR